MTRTMPHKLALLIPQTLAVMPGLRLLPWPGPFSYLPKRAQLIVGEQVSNRLFKTQLVDGELDFLDGVSLRLQIKDMGFDWCISKRGSRLEFSRGSEGAETTFSGNTREFLLLASRREDPDTLFFQRRLTIEGNTELGLEIKNLIDSVDLDELPTLLNHALYLSAEFVEALPR